MPDPKWYTKRGTDGKWYKTQAASPEEAAAKFTKSMGGTSPAPAAAKKPEPSATPTPQQPFASRIDNRVMQNVEGAIAMPGNIIRDARARQQAKHPEPQSIVDRLANLPSAAQSAIEALSSGGVEPAAKGLYGVSMPGLIGRIQDKEDPANIAADAGMMLTPGTEEAGGLTHGVTDPTKAGSLVGSMTRGKSLLDRVDAAAKSIPVDHTPAYSWAQKAMALEKYGYTVPSVVKAFVQMVESRAKPGADALGGRSFIDRGASMHPLRYEDARAFEQSLGAKIPWEQDPGGKMGGLMKKMRESLGQETAAALKPHGLDIPYLRGKAELTKAYGARGRYGPIGKVAGKVAGYGTGGAVGHPLILGYVGGRAGESMAGSMIDSVVNAGRER